MRLVVIESVFPANGGDSAILYGLLDALQAAQPDLDLTVVSDYADLRRPAFDQPMESPLFHSGPPIKGLRAPLRSLQYGIGIRKAVRSAAAGGDGLLGALHEADGVITCGGGMYHDHYNITPRLAQRAVVHRMGIPLAVHAQSIGPFSDHRKGRAVARDLRRCEHVAVRDALSAQVVAAMGVAPERSEQVPDAAWAMRPAAEARTQVGQIRGAKLGISVRPWRFPGDQDPADAIKRYETAVAAMADHIVQETEATPVFVSTCNHPDYRYNDNEVASRIRARMAQPEEAVVVDAGIDPRQIQAELGALDALVATRFHALLLAASAGTPVAGIGYEPKTIELLRTEGQERHFIGIDRCTPDALAALVDALLDARPAQRSYWATRSGELADESCSAVARSLAAVRG